MGAGRLMVTPAHAVHNFLYAVETDAGIVAHRYAKVASHGFQGSLRPTAGLGGLGVEVGGVDAVFASIGEGDPQVARDGEHVDGRAQRNDTQQDVGVGAAGVGAFRRAVNAQDKNIGAQGEQQVHQDQVLRRAGSARSTSIRSRAAPELAAGRKGVQLSACATICAALWRVWAAFGVGWAVETV